MLVYSCEEKGFVKTKDIINEKEMVDILYDLHLAKSMSGINYYTEEGDTLKYTSDDFYQAVLDKYDIEDSTLANSIIYYSAYPKIYEKIYQQVVDRFNQGQDELTKNTNMSIEGEVTE